MYSALFTNKSWCSLKFREIELQLKDEEDLNTESTKPKSNHVLTSKSYRENSKTFEGCNKVNYRFDVNTQNISRKQATGINEFDTLEDPKEPISRNHGLFANRKYLYTRNERNTTRNKKGPVKDRWLLDDIDLL